MSTNNKVEFTKDQMADMQARYAANSSLKELASVFKVSVPTVARHLKASGVTLRSKGRIRGKGNTVKYTRKPKGSVKPSEVSSLPESGGFDPATSISDMDSFLSELGAKS